MLLVVGLGNPGREYASHRHNVGFMAVDELAARLRADAFREKFSGSYARASLTMGPQAAPNPGAQARAHIGDQQVVLLKPMTFMNESGRSVQAAMAFFKVTPRETVVIHDELDLPFGEVRLKLGGGHAGHNGLRSLMAHMSTGDFGRVRFGIGRPPPGFRGEVADFVLSGFDPVERAKLPDSLKVAVESVLDIAARGIDAAMNVRNTRPKQAKPKPKSKGDLQNPDAGSAGEAKAPPTPEKLSGST